MAHVRSHVELGDRVVAIGREGCVPRFDGDKPVEAEISFGTDASLDDLLACEGVRQCAVCFA